MILVDTSVWIDHLRRGNEELVAALEAQDVVIQAFVIGELACGDLHPRSAVLTLLQRLPKTNVAMEEQALDIIERRRLMGRGLGYIDVHLLAAALLSPPLRLRTLDRPLATEAARLGLAAQ